MSELIDPATLNYPATADERFTYARLKLAVGERMLNQRDVTRIESARARRQFRWVHRDKPIS